MPRATYKIVPTFSGSDWPGVFEARSDTERRTYSLEEEPRPQTYEPARPQRPPARNFPRKRKPPEATFDVVGQEAAFAGDDWPSTIEVERQVIGEPAARRSYTLHPSVRLP